MEKIEGLKAILFDYGSTLDTNATHWAYILWDAYCHAGVPVSEEQFRQAYVYGERQLGANNIICPDDNFVKLYNKKVALEIDHLAQEGHWFPLPDERQRATEAIVAYCRSHVEPFITQARSLLAELKERFTLVLVTNFYGNIHSLLDDFKLTPLFDAVIESAVVGVRKPDARIYEMGLDKAGCKPEEAVVVGDSYSKDIIPAKHLGCHAVWMKGRGWKEEEADETLPDAVIKSLGELKTLF